MSSGRDYALAQLDRLPLPGWKEKLMRHKVATPADPRDLALAERIIAGVLKNLGLLNHLIDHFATHPGRIDPLVRKILAIAVYQVRFLTRVPASAAVDEAVEQTRRFGRPHAAAFVNALLRRAVSQPDVPLPDPANDPLKYAQLVLSHPSDLFKRWVAMLDVERAIAICEHNNREPPTLVRLFKGTSPKALEAEGITLTPHEQHGILVVEGARRATFASWAARGLAQVQDATAAGIAEHLDLQPGQDVLDRCAGLGTKTLQIHDILANTGWLMAVDPSQDRCKALRQLLADRKIENIAVVPTPMLRDVPQVKKPAFDRILVDVPCSNSGVLARRPEARYTQTEAALASLSKLQDQIMDDTAGYLRGGGRLVYSTCSIWPEENEQRVQRFLEAHRDYEQIESRLTLPSMDPDPARYHDGGFFAALQKR